MELFDNLTILPEDPILGLNDAFKKDERENKVNLSVGVYRTATLSPLIPYSVKNAEAKILDRETSKDYLPIPGFKDYLKAIENLVLGSNSPIIQNQEIFSLQSSGGSGALSIIAHFLRHIGQKIVHVSTPTWSNHAPIFQQVGIETKQYPYYDTNTHTLCIESMKDYLNQLPKSTAVLLHACCHNPTGFDPTKDEWTNIRDIIKKRELFPIIDGAYFGFKSGLKEDTEIVRHFANERIPFALAVSNSKNFGLYGERTGALILFTGNEEYTKKAASVLKKTIRANYTHAPMHGAKIVSTILHSEKLRTEWKEELDAMRDRIKEMRKTLIAMLSNKCSHADFSFLEKQCGMFSYCGLSEQQTVRLKEEFGLYMPTSGRINIAGLNQSNIEYVVDAISSVI